MIPMMIMLLLLKVLIDDGGDSNVCITPNNSQEQVVVDINVKHLNEYCINTGKNVTQSDDNDKEKSIESDTIVEANHHS